AGTAGRWLLLSRAALLGQVVFDLLTPQAIQSIVNKGILQNDINNIIRGSFWMAVFAIASMLFATGNAWYAARLGEEVGHRSRVRLYRKITDVSWRSIDRLET